MSWVDAGYLFVFLCNFLFMAGACLLLVKTLSAIQHSKLHQLDAIAETAKASKELHGVARQLARQLEKRQELNPAGPSQTSSAERNSADAGQELTQRLRGKLTDVLGQNMQLKGEIERMKARLGQADNSSQGIRTGLDEVKTADPRNSNLVRALTLKTDELRADLEDARRRAFEAEKIATSNAQKLGELSDTLSVRTLGNVADVSVQLDQLRAQNDALASREKNLLARIESMEQEFQRHLTEKSFIEDRYVKLDTQVG